MHSYKLQYMMKIKIGFIDIKIANDVSLTMEEKLNKIIYYIQLFDYIYQDIKVTGVDYIKKKLSYINKYHSLE